MGRNLNIILWYQTISKDDVFGGRRGVANNPHVLVSRLGRELSMFRKIY